MEKNLPDPDSNEQSSRLERFAEAIARLTGPWFEPVCIIGSTPFFYSSPSPEGHTLDREQQESPTRSDTFNSDPTLNKNYVNRQIKKLEKQFR